MIVWINGAYGAGKTTAAELLREQLPGSYLFDPEEIGNCVRERKPRSLWRDDFQDYPSWREMTVCLLRELYELYGGDILVPMSVVDPVYFEETVGRLEREGLPVRHFVLLASGEQLLERIRARGEDGDCWCARQIGRCVAALGHTVRGIEIETDGKPPAAVAAELLARIREENANFYPGGKPRKKPVLSNIKGGRSAMFREMRRKNQVLPPEECAGALDRGTSGVLALAGDGGYPYAVPLSYAYREGKLYFHCAREGHKLDALRRSPRASFCVIDRDRVVPREYTTYFRSVIAFGTVRILEDDGEKRAAIELLARKYAPEEREEDRAAFIRRGWGSMCLLELSIDHLSGKEGRELARRRAQGESPGEG